MSDYFTRLAERAVGLAETIKPRVPNRFEHPENNMPPMPPAEQDDEQLAKVEEAGALLKWPSEDPLPPRAEDRRVPAPRRPEAPPRGVSRSIQQPIPAPKVSNFPSEPRRLPMQPAPVLNLPLPTHDLQNATQDEIAKDKDGVRATPRTEETHVVHIRTESNLVPVSPATQITPRTAPQPTPEPTPERVPGTAPVEQTPPSVAEVQQPSRAISDQAPPVLRPRKKNVNEHNLMTTMSNSEHRAESRQEPTVKVTIGRVEVRAVMEPPKVPVKTRKPANRAMSLDEYLKRHEVRRR